MTVDVDKGLRRFLAKIKRIKGGCWLYTGGLTSGGYGNFFHDGKQWRAHRFMWTLRRGHIPDGKQVLHKCDVRNCVRLGHLFLGTSLDNILDMIQKGRDKFSFKANPRKGELAPAAKLLVSHVIEIKRRSDNGESRASIARDIGVHPSHISRIVLGQKWAGV